MRWDCWDGNRCERDRGGVGIYGVVNGVRLNGDGWMGIDERRSMSIELTLDNIEWKRRWIDPGRCRVIGYR